MKKLTTFAAAVTATAALSTGAIADSHSSPVVVKAVGTWGSLTNYQKHEGLEFVKW